VIDKAKMVLSRVEQTNNTDITDPLLAPLPDHPIAWVEPQKNKKEKKRTKQARDNQLELFNTREESIIKMLEKIDISRMTPLEAINFLNDLKQKSIQ
jgi:DNA mismatch repair protein MutS